MTTTQADCTNQASQEDKALKAKQLALARFNFIFEKIAKLLTQYEALSEHKLLGYLGSFFGHPCRNPTRVPLILFTQNLAKIVQSKLAIELVSTSQDHDTLKNQCTLINCSSLALLGCCLFIYRRLIDVDYHQDEQAAKQTALAQALAPLLQPIKNEQDKHNCLSMFKTLVETKTLGTVHFNIEIKQQLQAISESMSQATSTRPSDH